MEGTKGSISKVIISMTNVSNASFKELRREISFRKKIEQDLKEEIATRMEAERKLLHLANHDALTDLPNRRLFEELCNFSIINAKRYKQNQATLFIDIDNFKTVNDTLGHKAGDALLVMIAQRLTECVRQSDIVSRFGGDEFLIHLGGDCSLGDAETIAQKIVQSLTDSFELKEGTANIGASIGISLFPNDAESVDQLIKNADKAMYTAKESGKNQYKLFSDI